MEGERLATLSLFSVLVDIQDITCIRQKIRDKNTAFINGAEVKPWDLVAFVRETIVKNINYWRAKEIIGTPTVQSPNTTFSRTQPHAQPNHRKQTLSIAASMVLYLPG